MKDMVKNKEVTKNSWINMMEIIITVLGWVALNLVIKYRWW